MITYTLKRSARRTLAIHVLRDATVEVRAPLRISQRRIDKFVDAKRDWIEQKLAQMEALQAERVINAPTYGMRIPLLGREVEVIGRCAAEHVLVALDEVQMMLEVMNAELDRGETHPEQTEPMTAMPERAAIDPDLDDEGIRAALAEFYRALAAEYLPERVRYFARIMGVQPSAVKISNARKRWGSCSGKNSLNFAWRLMMTPPECVDYVVVHELAHIREHNHSPEFWAIVEDVMPDYRRRTKLLRSSQKRIDELEL